MSTQTISKIEPENDHIAENVAHTGKELDTSLLRGHGGDHYAAEPEPTLEPESFSLRRLLHMFLLGVVGFVLGLVVFLPADSLWVRTLNQLNTESTSFSWAGVESSGLFGATFQDARFQIHGITLCFTEMQISPGLTKPLRIRGITGQHALEMSFSWGKRLQLQGQADTGVLLDAGKPLGASAMQADLQFQDWGGIPGQGALKIQGLTFELSPKLSVDNLTLDLTKQGQDVRINTLGTDKPLPMQAAGTLKLDPENLLESPYSVSGSITMGNKSNKFKKSGKLGELAKLAQGGNMAEIFQ